jgi:prepilin-type N-terminal cleavage/methylation domain-containing protein
MARRSSPGSDPSRRGFTLLELATALTLLAVVMSHFLPAARRQLDRLAVVGAREELVGCFHRARQVAVQEGGSTLRIVADPPGAQLFAGGRLLESFPLSDPYRVTVTLSRERKEAELSFDALGLGRVASQTILVERGEARAALVVSSLGRVSKR